jgi:hypothetical protein
VRSDERDPEGLLELVGLVGLLVVLLVLVLVSVLLVLVLVLVLVLLVMVLLVLVLLVMLLVLTYRSIVGTFTRGRVWLEREDAIIIAQQHRPLRRRSPRQFHMLCTADHVEPYPRVRLSPHWVHHACLYQRLERIPHLLCQRSHRAEVLRKRVLQVSRVHPIALNSAPALQCLCRCVRAVGRTKPSLHAALCRAL